MHESHTAAVVMLVYQTVASNSAKQVLRSTNSFQLAARHEEPITSKTSGH